MAIATYLIKLEFEMDRSARARNESGNDQIVLGRATYLITFKEIRELEIY